MRVELNFKISSEIFLFVVGAEDGSILNFKQRWKKI